jgi:hypothetical protein
MLRQIEPTFGPEELNRLILAASTDTRLKDNEFGNFRLMDRSGREAPRVTRDASEWTQANADGKHIVVYGAKAVARVREALGEHAPAEADFPHIEMEKEALSASSSSMEVARGKAPVALDAASLSAHEFLPSYKLKWRTDHFEVERVPSVPLVWWAVAQNVIVPLKARQLHRLYPAAIMPILQDPHSWGAVGHLAWVLSKNPEDDLSADPMFHACSAGVASAGEWPYNTARERGWPSACAQGRSNVTDSMRHSKVGEHSIA